MCGWVGLVPAHSLLYNAGMVIPLDPKCEIRFIAEDDRELPAEQQTVFLIRSLSARQQADVQNNSITVSNQGGGDMDTEVKTGEWAISVLNYGLTGWENFPPGEDKDLPFRANGAGQKRKVSDDTLSRIPTGVRSELAAAIWDGTDLADKEAKN